MIIFNLYRILMKQSICYLAIILLVLITGKPSSAQDYPATYYHYTNQAELAIVRADYAQAAANYKDAFKANIRPFATDVYNALCCALRLNNQKDSYKYCLLLAKKGVGENFFEKKALFNDFKQKDKGAWHKILAHARGNRKKFDANFRSLNAQLNNLYNRDQQVHRLLQQPGRDYEQTEILVKKSDDSISRELMKVYERWGFLSEFNMGAFVSDDTVLQLQPPFYIIMLHNFQGISSYDTLFAPMCKKAIQEGTLHPMVYAGFRDGNPANGNVYYGTAHYIIGYKCSIYKEVEDADTPEYNTIKRINKQRAKIFIPSFEDALQKIVFRIQNPDSEFEWRDHYGRIRSFANKESEQHFLERHKLMVDQIPGCTE